MEISALIGEGNGIPLQYSCWKLPWTEEPGRLQSMGSLSMGHDWVISLSLFTFMDWRRKWQPTPVFLPGESQGRGSLVGCPWLKRLSSSSSLNCSTCGCSAVGTEYNELFCRLCYCCKKTDSNCFSISVILQSTKNVIIYRYFANNSFFFLSKHRICHLIAIGFANFLVL